MKNPTVVKITTVCAWCRALISEQECPETKDYRALSNNGVIISHGLCKICKKAVEIEYGLNKKGENHE